MRRNGAERGAPGAPGAPIRPPAVAARRESGTLVMALSGDWDMERAVPGFDEVMAGQSDLGNVAAVRIATAELGDWDSSLLTFLVRGTEYCEAHDLELEDGGLPEDVTRLLSLARAVPEREPARPEPVGSIAERLGKGGIRGYRETLAGVAFAGEVAQGLARVALRRTRLRWRQFWVVVQSSGAGALPIVTLIAFLVGAIISFLGAVVLRRFGAGYYVSYLVGYGVLRELGALMTGIIMAGRTGAAFAAELGSMKVTEEIDALRTLGISPVDHLVLPRVLGLFLMMPLLTIYADAVGVLGGWLVAITLLDLTATEFVRGLLDVLTLGDALLGVFKGAVFGGVIGIAGCMNGLRTGSDAGAVGRAATSAVVLGITGIIVANAVIDWLAAMLGV